MSFFSLSQLSTADPSAQLWSSRRALEGAALGLKSFELSGMDDGSFKQCPEVIRDVREQGRMATH
jgi:hypothetical protein